MTNLLIKLFIKDNNNIKKANIRTSYGKLASTVGILCNIVLAACKFAIGFFSGSIAIAADALNNLTDATSSIVTLVGFKISEKPADSEHPFGHARSEYLSGLFVAIIILFLGVETFQTSIGKILNPTEVEFSMVTVAVLVLSVLLKVWMTFFNNKLADIINSQALKTTAIDSRNDAISTTAILIVGVVSITAKINLDGIMGAIVSVIIMWSGVSAIKETIKPILGECANEELAQKVAKKILSYDGVLGMHDLMLHDYGPSSRFASVHVEMDASTDIMESHDIIDDIERDFAKQENIHLVIHFDPVITDDVQLNETREFVYQVLQNIDKRLTMHDFRMVKGPLHTNLIFDVVVPYDFHMTTKQLKTEIDSHLESEKVVLYTVITFDTGFTAVTGQKDPVEEKLIHKRN